MKIYAFFIVLVLSAGIAFAAVNTQYIGHAPDLRITLPLQDPDPVEPGKEVEVSFKIENNGTTAENVIFAAVPEYPFTLVPGEDAARTIGTIGTSQNGKQSVIVRYRAKVAEDAVDGSNEFKIRYKSDSFGWITIENLNVKVQSRNAIISVDKFITEPEVVSPGSKAALSIVLKNYAASLLRDVRVVLDLGKSGDEITPFSPVGSTNEKVIAHMDPQSSKIVEFDLLVDPDAASKSYKIPISIQYSDSTSKNFSKSNIITVIVGGEPDISVGIDSSTIYTPGSAGEINIKIVNKGLPDMKFVNVKLNKSDGYRAISPTEVYIGNIDSDDYETADFKLYAEKTSEKLIEIPLTIEYKDANNKDYEKTINLELPLYTSSEAKKLGLVQGSGKSSWIVIIILVVAAFFGYRYWKKRRKHN